MTRLTVEIDADQLDEIVIQRLEETMADCLSHSCTHKKDIKQSRKMVRHLRKVINWYAPYGEQI